MKCSGKKDWERKADIAAQIIFKIKRLRILRSESLIFKVLSFNI